MVALLETRKLTKKFGGLTAVDTMDLVVEEGEIHGLIGPNGAGKTTLFSLISGIVPPTSGEVLFKGSKITHFAPHKIAKLGLGRTFQRSAVFHGFTVLENVLISMHTDADTSIWHALVNLGPTYKKDQIERAKEILDFVGLLDFNDDLAENLALGHQRSLGIAMALATSPQLLMLDEPAAGMNAKEAKVLDSLIRKVQKEQGITVVLVEHDMKLVMEICDRISAINFGAKLTSGTPQEILNNKDVIDAYLGRGDTLEEELLNA